MNKFIVVTTIFPPSKAIIKFNQMTDWKLLVVGDLKTPHELYKNINCIYFHPDKQKEKYPAYSELLGYNCSARRNLGFIEAYNLGADIIAMVDDDNIPYDNWGKEVYINTSIKTNCYTSDKLNVFDPLSATLHPHLWHRGFPLECVKDRKYNVIEKAECLPLIQANLWNGDPDIDAIERLIFDHEVIFDNRYFTTNIKYAPFNSQNTILARKVIPYFMLLHGVGRVDDIWGAYLMEEELNLNFPYLLYGPPTVYQKRNNHNIYEDMDQEVYGIKNVKNLLNDFSILPDRTKELYHQYRKCFND